MQLTGSIRERMAGLSPDIRFVSVIPMPARVDAMRGQWRVGATLFSLFGALVLLALTAPLVLALWADQFQGRILSPFWLH